MLQKLSDTIANKWFQCAFAREVMKVNKGRIYEDNWQLITVKNKERDLWKGERGANLTIGEGDEKKLIKMCRDKKNPFKMEFASTTAEFLSILRDTSYDTFLVLYILDGKTELLRCPRKESQEILTDIRNKNVCCGCNFFFDSLNLLFIV